VQFLNERKSHSLDALARIRCPVRLIHGEADVAYSVAYSEKFLDNLQEAGLDAVMHIVPDAPQHVSLSHPEM
jgi:dipeptidyl aminopeptidase/acylaminoacyl peptidase